MMMKDILYLMDPTMSDVWWQWLIMHSFCIVLITDGIVWFCYNFVEQ